jgi:hypothetical protein
MNEKTKAAGHKNPDDDLNLGIIITPMLDMSFQLLAFFIMIYQPPISEVEINTKWLPPEKLLAKGAVSTPKPEKKDDISSDVTPDPSVKDMILVIIKAVDPKLETKQGKSSDVRKKAGKKEEGQPWKILIKLPEDLDVEMVADEQLTIEEGWLALKKRLEEIRKTLNPLSFKEDQKELPAVSTSIKIMPDGLLRQKYVLQAWDVCKVAGFKKDGQVSFVTVLPPEDGSKPGTISFKKPKEE